MRNADNIFSGLVYVFVIGAALVLSVYVFAFLLPFVLVLIAAAVLYNAARYWYFRRKILKGAEELMKQTPCPRRSKKAKEIIDVEYEVVDENYKSNKSE